NIGLDGRSRAVGEIGEGRRRLESREMLRLSGAIRSMTRDAAGLVDLFAGIELQRADRQRRRTNLRGRDIRMRDEQKKDEQMCATELEHARHRLSPTRAGAET